MAVAGVTKAALGCDYDPLPVAWRLKVQCLRQRRLGDAEPIGTSGVKEVDTSVQSCANRLFRLLKVGVTPVATIGPRAKADSADFYTCFS